MDEATPPGERFEALRQRARRRAAADLAGTACLIARVRRVVGDADPLDWRIFRQGPRYRRETLDGQPVALADGVRSWRFFYPGDSLYVASDAAPVPCRGRSLDRFWALDLPPVLPENFQAFQPGQAGDHDGAFAWTFLVDDSAEHGRVHRWQVVVDPASGYLRQFGFVGALDVWSWHDLTYVADADPELFTWRGPDRSLEEAAALRAP